MKRVAALAVAAAVVLGASACDASAGQKKWDAQNACYDRVDQLAKGLTPGASRDSYVKKNYEHCAADPDWLKK